MTDLEISKALALAIGWAKADFLLYPEHLVLISVMRRFDYRDWNVISPIAERYNAFPYHMHGYWETSMDYGDFDADTPQKAIALAVIENANNVS